MTIRYRDQRMESGDQCVDRIIPRKKSFQYTYHYEEWHWDGLVTVCDAVLCPFFVNFAFCLGKRVECSLEHKWRKRPFCNLYDELYLLHVDRYVALRRCMAIGQKKSIKTRWRGAGYNVRQYS